MFLGTGGIFNYYRTAEDDVTPSISKK